MMASLTPEQRQQIRDMRDANPKLRYWMIAAKFGISSAYVAAIVCGRTDKPAEKPRQKTLPIPACTVQQPGSIIRPIPLSRLTARR